MRRILLAVLVAVAAPASVETVIWTGEVHVEKWVSDGEFYGYWWVGYGNMPGVRQFAFDGRTCTVDLFYITNTPRSLLAGAERRGSPGILPTDRGLAWLVDGPRFELADHDRSFPDQGVAVWDNSGLDWQDGQPGASATNGKDVYDERSRSSHTRVREEANGPSPKRSHAPSLEGLPLGGSEVAVGNRIAPVPPLRSVRAR